MKRSPLKRKVSLREGQRRKLLALPPRLRETAVRKASLGRTRLKRMSKGLRATTAKYRKLETEFLARPENKWCEICTRRREAGENIVRNQSTEVHHFAGRIGRLLCYVPYFIASCFFCRCWPHDHPRKARELRLLAEAKDWNVFPD